MEAFLTAAEKHAQHGVTTLIPTATSVELSRIVTLDRLLEEANARKTHDADMPVLHLEGPCFAYGQRGAQEMGRELKRRGILAAIGHSDAGYAEVEAAWEAGYTHVTHLYSGMSSLHRRNAYRYVGVVESAYLIDGMTVEIIADGKHLPAELLKFVYKFKGPERTALVTDSMRGAGLPDDPSMLGHYEHGLSVIIEDDVAKLPDRTSFAGSVATFDRLVRNMLRMARAPLADVITMAARTPARIMGFADRGEIAPGMRAYLTFFDEDIRVSRTMVAGRTIYLKGDGEA